MTIVILMMIIEVDIFNLFIFSIKNDRSTFSHFAFCIVRIIIVPSFQRWQASLAYSLPALPSFFLSLLHSGVFVGAVGVCKWPLCCLWRFCGSSVLVWTWHWSDYWPNIILFSAYDGMPCNVLVFWSFFPALIFSLFQRLWWHGLSSCRLQSKLKHQECKFSTCNFSQGSFKVPQHFTGEQSTNDWSTEV